MKRFVVEKRTNPTDNWEEYKKFNDLKTAKQSLETLNKHRYNLFKNSEYDKYRLYDKLKKVYIKD